MAGLSFLKKGEYQKALDHLDHFSGGDAILGPSTIAAKAACYSGLGKLDKAADLYEKLPNWATMNTQVLITRRLLFTMNW